MSSQSIGEKTPYRGKQNNTVTKKRGYKTNEINITVLFEAGRWGGFTFIHKY